MRLIDADALLDRISLNYNDHQNITAGAMKDIINTTPTAYDVEKVVAELESKRSYKELTNYYGDTIGVRNIDTIKIDKAIDIVKGGVE